MSQNTSNTRDFKATFITNYIGGGERIGENIQMVDVQVKIFDAETNEPILFDPETIMVHPSGGRIQISGIISKDRTRKGMPTKVPSLHS